MKKEKQETQLFSMSQDMGAPIAMWCKEEVFVKQIHLQNHYCVYREVPD